MSKYFYVSYLIGLWHPEFSPFSYGFEIYDGEKKFLQKLKQALLYIAENCSIHLYGNEESHVTSSDNDDGIEFDEDDEEVEYSEELETLLDLIDKRLGENKLNEFKELSSYFTIGDYEINIIVATSDYRKFCDFFIKTMLSELAGEEVDEDIVENYIEKYFPKINSDLKKELFNECPVAEYIVKHFQKDDLAEEFLKSNVNKREAFNLITLDNCCEQEE